MTSDTPSAISMALVNPQMSSTSADSKNSSTQHLSISVWVTVLNILVWCDNVRSQDMNVKINMKHSMTCKNVS